MESLGVQEKDLKESFTKSSGKGGQNVNKVATSVVLKHLPTGIQVKCSVYRTQGLNRYKARAILCEKILALQRSKNPPEANTKGRKIPSPGEPEE